jgi:hypothetical protein
MDVKKFKEVYLKVDPNGIDEDYLLIDKPALSRGKQPLPGPALAKFDGIINRCNGMSRSRLMKLLNAAVGLIGEDEVYLEVGSYQGGSLVSALFENDAKAVSVENFSQFTESNSQSILWDNLLKFDMENRVIMENDDFRSFFANKAATELKIGVYFYDGAHDTQSQLDGYELALPYLADQCLIFVDDYRYPEVKESVRLFLLAHPEFHVIFEREPAENFDPYWWDGLVILARGD